jgi:hypothetical protein
MLLANDAETVVVDDHAVAALPGMQMAFLDLVQPVSAGGSTAHSVSAGYTSPFTFTGDAKGKGHLGLDSAFVGALRVRVS